MGDIHVMKHGVRLFIRNPQGKVTLHDLVVFLAGGVSWFQGKRRESKESELVESGYGGFVYRQRSGIVGNLRVSSLGVALTVGQWTEAMIDAYSRANMLEQLAAMDGDVESGIARARGTVFSGLTVDKRTGEIGVSGPLELPGDSAGGVEVTFTEFGEAYLLDDFYWLVTSAVYLGLGWKSQPSSLHQIRGVARDLNFMIINPGQTYTIAPEGGGVARKLMDLYPRLPRNSAPYPVIVDLSADGEFVVIIGKAKRPRHS